MLRQAVNGTLRCTASNADINAAVSWIPLASQQCSIRPLSTVTSTLLSAQNSSNPDAGESEQDSHEDFKPKWKQQESPDSTFERVKTMVEDDINRNRIMVYMKGTPEAPMCGFSNIVCRVLDAYGQRYGSRNVLEDQELREGIKQYTDWPTIPQVFVEREFVGGSDIIYSMHQKGELDDVLGPPHQEQSTH